ncbi:hypothetical protein, partial [Pseudomonas gessardii]|uniref:hypothetical protein n=1 Tax=Pseudomonas gessardii TaxID=78544 RepID=UPI001F3B40D0
PAASYFGRRLRSLAAVELFPNYLALKAHIGFLPCVVYGSLTFHWGVTAYISFTAIRKVLWSVL